MAFDNSRFTFDPWKNYSGVVMEQGRVQLDSDWNKWHRRFRAASRPAPSILWGTPLIPPRHRPPFRSPPRPAPTPSSSAAAACMSMAYSRKITASRPNASGIPRLAELSGAPQPPPQPPPPPSSSNTIDFAHQPYLPGASVPTDTASYLFYLDVWTRPVTFLEDANLIDKAVGVDTTGRLQTVWQVKYMPAGTYTCATPTLRLRIQPRPPACSAPMSSPIHRPALAA